MADVCEVTGTSLDVAGDVWANAALVVERSSAYSVSGGTGEVSIAAPYSIVTNASGVMGTSDGGTFTSGFALVQGYSYAVTPYTASGRALRTFYLNVPTGTASANIDTLIVDQPVAGTDAAIAARDDAEAAAALAQQWAAEDEDTAVSGGLYSALHYAAKAADSETAAGVSETASATSATAAASSATAAASSATASSTSATAAAASATSAAASAASGGNIQSTQVIGKVGDPVTGGVVPAGTRAFGTPIAVDGTITTVRVYATNSFTISLRVFARSGDTFTQVGSDTDISVVSGLNSIAVSIPVTAGQYIGWYAAAGVIRSNSGGVVGGEYYGVNVTDASEFTDTAATLDTELEIGFDVDQTETVTALLATAQTDVNLTRADARTTATQIGTLANEARRAIGGLAATSSYGGTAFGGWAGALRLDRAETGAEIVALGFQNIYVGAAATKIRLRVYHRQDATPETLPPPSACEIVFDQEYTLAEIGLTADDSDRANIDLTFPTRFIKRAGYHLAWRWEALDVSDGLVGSSTGFVAVDGDQDQRGWNYSSTSATAYSNVGSPNRVGVVAYRTGAASMFETVDATLSVSGSDIVVSGTYATATDRSAVFSATVTLSAAASGKERVDKIVMDRDTKAITVVAGSERDEQLDAIEYQGATTSNNVLLGRARVTDGDVQAVGVTRFRGLIRRGTEREVAWHVERNRRILRAVISKAQRAAAINWGGYGDSITAIQANVPGYTANGIYRDRITGQYFDDYPADTKALVTLYDTGDGQGQVHSRIGWNWDIKAALDELAGSAVTTYLNYGLGGTTTQSTTDNGLFASRIAEPLGDSLDAVVISFGMNERGQSYTYANIVNMIGQFQAVGTACVVMGVPRPDVGQHLTDWRYTNAALEAAAMDAGAAYVSTVAIADDATLGGIGVPAAALGAANTQSGLGSHPGLYEFDVYGRSAVQQLGL